jgi:formylglycine-generating enzyme required for sulfatase activity
MALVIGIANYNDTDHSLKNAVKDARDLGAKLTDLNFDATVVVDPTRDEIKQSVDAFTKKLRKDDVALFYYSGHGAQVNGLNYLLPKDFDFSSTNADITSKEADAQWVHAKIVEAKTRLNIVILDACRTAARKGARSFGTNKGWSSMDVGRGTLFAFATAPNEEASDNTSGSNGLYTAHLLQALDKPGWTLSQVFHQTTEAVAAASHNTQTPWTAESVVGDFVFRDESVLKKHLDAINSERARLEALLRKQNEDFNKLKTQQEKDEAAARRQITQLALDAQNADAARVQQELARDNKLKADLEAERRRAADRIAQMEAETRQAEAAIQLIRQTPPTPESTGMTLDEARARVAQLESQLSDARKKTAADRQRALDRLETSYAPNRALLAKDPERLEIERTLVWQAKVQETRRRRQELEDQYAKEKKATEDFYTNQAANYKEPVEIRMLQTRTYNVLEAAEWTRYYPDEKPQVLTFNSGGKMFSAAIDDEEIKPLFAAKATKGVFALRAARRLDGTLDAAAPARLVFQVTGKMYEARAVESAPPPTSSVSITDGRLETKEVGGLVYVRIPAGSFDMGCSPGDTECFSDENPTHKVTITKPFWIGQTEVTQEAYQRAIGKNPSHFTGDPKLPVETVSWNDAQAYCQKVGMRLPTEAEWEYAARGGTKESRYVKLEDTAWHGGNSQAKTHPVAGKLPNGFGLYDMLGNVWEWVTDFFGNYGGAAQTNPTGPGKGTERVLRGGSWLYVPRDLRASVRLWFDPALRFSFIGARCVGE